MRLIRKIRHQAGSSVESADFGISTGSAAILGLCPDPAEATGSSPVAILWLQGNHIPAPMKAVLVLQRFEDQLREAVSVNEIG
jgi:hypothetical protein